MVGFVKLDLSSVNRIGKLVESDTGVEGRNLFLSMHIPRTHVDSSVWLLAPRKLFSRLMLDHLYPASFPHRRTYASPRPPGFPSRTTAATTTIISAFAQLSCAGGLLGLLLLRLFVEVALLARKTSV